MLARLVSLAARDREAVRGDRALPILRPGAQRRLQDLFDRADQGLVGIVEQQPATRPQQVRQTRLMPRVCELPIRLPAVAHEHAGIVLPDDDGGLRHAAARLNGIHGGLGRDKGPRTLAYRTTKP